MVDAKQMMVNETFDNIENPETHQHGANQHFARPGCVRLKRPARQDRHTGSSEQVGRDVEKSIPQRVEFQISVIYKANSTFHTVDKSSC